MFENLREESLAALVELDLPGYAIGGVSVGEPKEEMQRIVAHTPHRLPADKPRYLMGVGTPEDLVDGVAAGVDMFDCVMPTRNARNGHLFTRFGDLRIRNARYKTDERADRPDLHLPRPARASRAPTCTTSTAAARCSAPMLASVHNLHYYVEPDARGARRARGGPLRRLRGGVSRRSRARHLKRGVGRALPAPAAGRQHAGRSPPADARRVPTLGAAGEHPSAHGRDLIVLVLRRRRRAASLLCCWSHRRRSSSSFPHSD